MAIPIPIITPILFIILIGPPNLGSSDSGPRSWWREDFRISTTASPTAFTAASPTAFTAASPTVFTVASAMVSLPAAVAAGAAGIVTRAVGVAALGAGL